MAKTINDLGHNEGAVVTHHGQEIAAYKDETGKIYTLDPHCTHVSCLVEWNDTDKTWDCTCHGSRFTARGEVLNGPAEMDLMPAQD